MATTDAPNTTTLPEAAIQPTMTEQDKSRKVISLVDTLLTAPVAPTGTTVTPVTQQVQTGEVMGTQGVQGTVAAAQPTAGVIPTITAATAPTATTATGPTTATPASMTAATVAGATPTMTAQTGTVTAPMTGQTGTITSDAVWTDKDGTDRFAAGGKSQSLTIKDGKLIKGDTYTPRSQNLSDMTIKAGGK